MRPSNFSRACRSQVAALLHDETTNTSVHDNTPALHVAQHTRRPFADNNIDRVNMLSGCGTVRDYPTNAYHTSAFKGSRVAGNLENRPQSRIREGVGVLVVVAARVGDDNSGESL